MKSEYAQLKETLGAVTQERDLAVWERNQLQGKLENLEQVLKVRTLTLICQNHIPRSSVSWDPNSGVFTEPNPFPESFLLPVLHCFHLVIFHYLMPLTCLLPSSVALGGLTRSCEPVEAWGLPPFPFLVYPFMLSHSPRPAFPLSPLPLLDL